MTKWIAGCLLGIMAFAFLIVTCGFVNVITSNEKHTGPLTVRSINGRSVELIRDNGEFFEMMFDPDGTEPSLEAGDVLGDLVYTDLKNHREFFVKATFIRHKAVDLAAKVLYEDEESTGTFVNCRNGWCMNAPRKSHKLYKWSDGAYRVVPEKVKK